MFGDPADPGRQTDALAKRGGISQSDEKSTLEPSVTWWLLWVSRARCCVVPVRFGEDASGYAYLFEVLGPPEGCLLAWKRPAIIGAIYSSLC